MKLNMRQFFKNISDGCSKHAPEIFTGLGIAGMGATMYTVYKLAPKVNDKLAENPDMVKKLQNNLYNYVKDKYSIDAVCKQRVEFYKSIVKK